MVTLPWRGKATNTVDTLVWDSVYCARCRLTYIRPTDNDEPCPYCHGMTTL